MIKFSDAASRILTVLLIFANGGLGQQGEFCGLPPFYLCLVTYACLPQMRGTWISTCQD